MLVRRVSIIQSIQTPLKQQKQLIHFKAFVSYVTLTELPEVELGGRWTQFW